MKRQAHLPLIQSLDNLAWKSEQLLIQDLLYKQGTTISVDCLNWPDAFPYAPKTTVWSGRSNTSLFLFFQVEEKEIRSVHCKDNAPVWEDSCVEFFVSLPSTEEYMNFEFNSLGYCLAARRKSREDFFLLSPDQLADIKRFAEQKEGFQNENSVWSLVVSIPFELLGLSGISLPAALRANFYKCCSACTEKHYLSWSTVHSAKPDFHRPEDFGHLLLDEANKENV